MRDYGRVHTSFWTSATIRSMSEDGRSLAAYLLTCPHGTIAGVFRAPDGYVCEDMQWTAGRVSKGFLELLSNGFANRCETTKWVWIIKHFEWNPPENPNQRKAVAKVVDMVPDQCGWKPRFIRDCWGFYLDYEPVISNPSETVPETLSEPSLNQYQEQEQEQEQEQDAAAGSRQKDSAKRKPAKQQEHPLFTEVWSVIPKRTGDSRVEALEAFSARLKQGKEPEAILAGVKAYAAFCEAQQIIEPGWNFQKSASTFLGPKLHFESDWTPPKQVLGPTGATQFGPTKNGPPKTFEQMRHERTEAAISEFIGEDMPDLGNVIEGEFTACSGVSNA